MTVKSFTAKLESTRGGTGRFLTSCGSVPVPWASVFYNSPKILLKRASSWYFQKGFSLAASANPRTRIIKAQRCQAWVSMCPS